MKALIDIKSKYSKLLLGVFFSCFLIVALLVSMQDAHAQKSTCDYQHRECFTEAGYPACYKKIDIEKYYQFVAENNLELAEQIVADESKCVKLKGNQRAYMQDKGGGFVKFVLRGQSVTFWAKREALFAR